MKDRVQMTIWIICLFSCVVICFYLNNVIDKYILPYAQFGIEKAFTEKITFVGRNIKMNMFSNGEMRDADDLMFYHWVKIAGILMVLSMVIMLEFRIIKKVTGIDMKTADPGGRRVS